MMDAYRSILWQEFILFKRKFWSITAGAMVSPILYLIAFGWGVGGNIKVEGKSYILFIIPGIIALNTMMISFNRIATSMNISRMYDKTFEEFMAAPIKVSVYALGKITAGALRGMYSGTLIIFLSILFRTGFAVTPYFILIMLLNCFVFSALGFTAGVIIDSHQDISKFTNFVITPMSFLCGTFFPVDKMPVFIKQFIWILPLTHTSSALRNCGSEGLMDMLIHILILILYFITFFIIGIKYCMKAE